MALTEPLTAAPVTARADRIGPLHGHLFLLDPQRPGVLLIWDASGGDLAHAPVFDLSVGEHVTIRSDDT